MSVNNLNKLINIPTKKCKVGIGGIIFFSLSLIYSFRYYKYNETISRDDINILGLFLSGWMIGIE